MLFYLTNHDYMDTHGEAMVIHVKDEVLPHHGKPNQGKICSVTIK